MINDATRHRSQGDSTLLRRKKALVGYVLRLAARGYPSQILAILGTMDRSSTVLQAPTIEDEVRSFDSEKALQQHLRDSPTYENH